jgi:hypothetical protein
MPAKLLKISYPVPSDKNGHEFSSAEELLSLLGSENSGQYLVGSQGMWHGGIHITDATVPWCALSADTAAEREYLAKNASYRGGQFIRCMAEGKIVAWRVCKDYDSAAIAWRDGHVFQSTSFVLVEHYIQPGEKDSSGLTFHTLYMNMAPFEAYITEEGANQRKVAKSQRYYASKEDVLASPAKPAGTLPGGTAVTLSDNLITRGSDRRQFTQVTLSAEAKNTAGKKLAAGTPVWTVSDQGSLLAASSAVPVPSWWTKCSPAYGNQTGAGVQCTARTNWQFYLSSDDVLKGNNAGSLTAGFPLTYEPDNAGQQMTRPAKNTNEAARIFSLVTLGRNAGKMKKGDRVWVVSDGDSLTKTAQAAAGGEPKFGEVVIPATPVEINAGDSIGHMGFYELPEEDGKQSRYQVHIECLSMDSKLPTFLTNPDKVGGDSPTFLKYPEGANLFAGNAEGAMVDTKRVTRAPGILTLSGVPVKRADEVVTHYQIHPEGGWLPAANIIKLPQWALGDLGFVTLDRKPESFDLIDGKKQPNNVVKGILAEMYKAAKADPRTGSALYHYNYDRLLKQIDRNNDGQFSEEEYIQAIRLPAYRDHLYRIIAKHPSEWWYGKDDALWKKYLDTLAKDAPSWKTYLETFIDRLTWMKSVAGIGPDPWHMHPVVFLEAIKPLSNRCFCYNQGIVDRPCQAGALNVTNNDFELLATEIGVEREVLRAIAVAETGDKVPFKQYVSGENHATILYERHYMKRLAPAMGVSLQTVRDIEVSEPKILHSFESGYRYGSDSEQYQRLLRAREINYDAANMSCSWGKFQVMGEYYHHLYESTKELVDAQNYCAMQHLQYFKVFLIKEKRMLQPMKDKNWLTIAKKYNGAGQVGYDDKIKEAYDHLKENW